MGDLMGKIKVDSEILKYNAERMQEIAHLLDKVSGEVETAKLGLRWNVSNSTTIRNVSISSELSL